MSSAEVKATRVQFQEIADNVQRVLRRPGGPDKVISSLRAMGYAGVRRLAATIVGDLEARDSNTYTVVPSAPATERSPRGLRAPTPATHDSGGYVDSKDPDAAASPCGPVVYKNDGVLRDVRPWLFPGAKWFPLVPCKYFINGKCHRGDDCTFLHQAAPDYTPPRGYGADRVAEALRREEMTDPASASSMSKGASRVDSVQAHGTKRAYEETRSETSRGGHDDRGGLHYRPRTGEDREYSRYDRDRGPSSSYQGHYDSRRSSPPHRRERESERDERTQEDRADKDKSTTPTIATDPMKNAESLLEKIKKAPEQDRPQIITMLDRYLSLQAKREKLENNIHVYEYLLETIERQPSASQGQRRHLDFLNSYLTLRRGRQDKSGQDAMEAMMELAETSTAEAKARAVPLLDRYMTLVSTL